MVSSTHGTLHAFLHRRLHRARGPESQNCLRHAGRHARRRSRRHRCVWGFAGPVEGLKHHRGITHTFIGVPLVAAAAVGAIWLITAGPNAPCASSESRSASPTRSPTAFRPQPVRWRWVYLAAFISALSHILLDWTKIYGVRPFFPSTRAGMPAALSSSPSRCLWALLFRGPCFPGIFGLAEREISSKRTPFRGRGWAIFALSGIFLFWCLRYLERG